jgi:Tfp pilus assembly protein FimT
MMGKQDGFTIIEVILFLAISAMLFLVAFSYTSSTIRQTRLTDGGDQLTSFIQNQYVSVKNTQSNRSETSSVKCDVSDVAPTTPGASNTCMVLGKVLYFNDNGTTVSVSTVVGNAVVATTEGTEIEVIRQLNPRVLRDTTGSIVLVDETFVMPWQMRFTERKYMSSPSTQAGFNAMVFLRSPVSENVHTGIWTVAAGAGAVPASYNIPALLSTYVATNVDRPVLICARSDDLGNVRTGVDIPVGQGVGRITKVTGTAGQLLSGSMACL